MSGERDLTTEEAAELLWIPRPRLIELLDAGQLPFHRLGADRRLRLHDVVSYRRRGDAKRRRHLSELTRLSEESEGGYR